MQAVRRTPRNRDIRCVTSAAARGSQPSLVDVRRGHLLERVDASRAPRGAHVSSGVRENRRRKMTDMAALRRSPAAHPFSERPLLAIWELTQACDLACVHCRACAVAERDPRELTTEE